MCRKSDEEITEMIDKLSEVGTHKLNTFEAELIGDLFGDIEFSDRQAIKIEEIYNKIFNEE